MIRELTMGSIVAALALLSPPTAARAQNVDTTTARAPDTMTRADTSGDHQRARRPRFYRSVVPGLRIVAVADGGTFITLQDGTEWEVYLPDRTSTVQWRRGDWVTVKLAPIAQGRYDYRLGNGRTDTGAIAKFRGRTGDDRGR
jgi:hypothetical protein